jgi:hypothetical protein
MLDRVSKVLSASAKCFSESREGFIEVDIDNQSMNNCYHIMVFAYQNLKVRQRGINCKFNKV